MAERSAGNVAAYQADSNGNPILATRQHFITGLTFAEGGFIDPITGDFLFSTFGTGSDSIYQIQGFSLPTPEPGTLLLMATGVPILVRHWRR